MVTVWMVLFYKISIKYILLYKMTVEKLCEKSIIFRSIKILYTLYISIKFILIDGEKHSTICF